MSKQEGKVFIGGLSWETTDQKLRAYFENYGTVQEAFVSYDKHTGRPRGFGFVVFADPIIADKVISVQHTIDRREVEAKRALPKEESPVSKDQQAAASGQRTKKIFVGGLAATVDEEAFRSYFEEFGAVHDAVVMFDHDRRPRGFGFITFAEEEAVDAVFARGTIQTIHDKQIEIKRAVPRDSMPPSPRTLHHRSPPMTHGAPPSPAYDRGPPVDVYRQHGPPAPLPYGGRGAYGGSGRYPGGGGGYRGGGYGPPGPGSYGPPTSPLRGGYGGAPRGNSGMRSPPHHSQHHLGGRGGMPPQPFTPPAVVTGIPASMAATPEGAAALASGQAVAAALPVIPNGPAIPGIPTGSQLAAMSAAAVPSQLQPSQLVASFGTLPANMQAAAAAAQLGSPPAAFGLQDASSVAATAQQQAAAAQAQAQVQAQVQAAQNLAELQQQVSLTTSLAQAQLQQAQAAQQQQQAQAAIWS